MMSDIILNWLLDSDPSIRWQVMQDLMKAPPDQVAAERARVAHEGWGAQLLSLPDENGLWSGGTYFPAGLLDDETNNPHPGQPWTATAWSLDLLRDFGVDPNDKRVREIVSQVRQNCRWEHDGQPFFEGEVEPCINGMLVGIGSYFNQNVDVVVSRLLGEQLEDGGWNCEAEFGSKRSSFHTTIRVLEGLLAHEQATGGTPELMNARQKGEEYLLERKLFRRKSNGAVIDPAWLLFSFPTRWHYDLLRALEYFRIVGNPPDPRMEEAIAILRSKQQFNGMWLLENTHEGMVHFALEHGDGQPSRWNTLRALRVIEWFSPSK